MPVHRFASNMLTDLTKNKLLLQMTSPQILSLFLIFTVSTDENTLFCSEIANLLFCISIKSHLVLVAMFCLLWKQWRRFSVYCLGFYTSLICQLLENFITRTGEFLHNKWRKITINIYLLLHLVFTWFIRNTFLLPREMISFLIIVFLTVTLFALQYKK